MQPIGEDALLGRAKLSGSCQHPTAVDPDRHLKSGGVLLRQAFRRQLGRAVKRNRSLGAKAFSDAGQTNRCRPRLPFVESKGRRLRTQWQLRQSRNRIDAAGAQENEAGTRGAAIFQQIDRA